MRAKRPIHNDRGFAGAVIDASVRDTPQIRKLQFPVFTEHRMIPFIEKFRSIREAARQFGRI